VQPLGVCTAIVRAARKQQSFDLRQQGERGYSD
jgi:hypothetical protein